MPETSTPTPMPLETRLVCSTVLRTYPAVLTLAMLSEVVRSPVWAATRPDWAVDMMLARDMV